MLTARERLARQRARPLLVELHHALSRLTSVLTVMNTGAHPDDEQSGMLAVLRFHLGMRVVIACSTRGEGGQNALGPERGGALGVLRTREMEEAARVLDADVSWLGFGPDDPVHDFGFSKSGEDTLARWGRERILERLVRAYRSERPDIVIPTFLDVPGQHGHHRAMTEAAEAAIALAADPSAFPEQLAEGLTPWRVAKFYLPAWSGGGGTYDDEVPPPNASVAVEADMPDLASGAAFAEIGEWSRAAHATQGMGQWTAEPKKTWPLHLKLGPGGPENDIRAHLPATLGELGDALGGEAGAALAVAQSAIADAIAAFPDRPAIVAALTDAAGRIAGIDTALKSEDRDHHHHRLARKQVEIDAAIMLAGGLGGTAWVEPPDIAAGGSATLFVHTTSPADIEPGLDLQLPPYIKAGEPTFEGGITRLRLDAANDAPMTSPFAAGFSSIVSTGPVAVTLVADVAGHRARLDLALEEPTAIVPAHSVSLEPEALVVPLTHLPTVAEITVRQDGHPVALELAALPGIGVQRSVTGFRVDLGRESRAGRYSLPLSIAGVPAHRMHQIAYPHIGRAQYAVPQALEILALELALPAGVRIGYVGGGSDRVGLWMRRMGLDVTDLDADGLAGDLSGYTNIVVGIFGYGVRRDLAAATEKLHRWIEAGGHLLTLYHRPSDGWLPHSTPPRRLEIGSPSLRWRVTDPGAEVVVLNPDHLLLRRPNQITAADWADWDKERGLYFAASWDAAYEPLLSMHDQGEASLTGGLLSASIGNGRHTHTSLVLHHQLDKLVPGAFRLAANLVQRA